MAGKKKNRTLPLIAGVCVIAALVVVLLVTRKAADKYEDEENETATLMDVTSEQITGFEIVSTAASGSTDSSGESTGSASDASSGESAESAADSQTGESSEIAFEKQNNEWHCVTDPDMDVNQTVAGTTAASFTGVTLDQTIEGVTDLSQYGLDNPSYVITIEYTEKSADSAASSAAVDSASDAASASESTAAASSDESAETKTATIAVGSTNETTSTVYCYLDDNTSTVYAVSTGITTNLSKTLADYEAESSTSSSESS